MNAREARTEFQRQRLTVEQLLDLLEKQQQTIRRLQAEIDRLKQRWAQYEPEIQSEIKRDDAPSGAATRYSLEAEEKRRRRRKKKKSPGRRKTHLKFADAERSQDIYPDNARRADCEVSRERAVWRLENGRAVLVGYRVFRAAGDVEPRIPGVTLRCEYGIEILVVLSFLVYIIGLSLEKACMVLQAVRRCADPDATTDGHDLDMIASLSGRPTRCRHDRPRPSRIHPCRRTDHRRNAAASVRLRSQGIPSRCGVAPASTPLTSQKEA